MKRIYFDNAASAPLSKQVHKKIIPYMGLIGNPSSSHLEGRKLRELICVARNQCAQALGCSPEEIFFTSGASEANSWAHKIWKLTVDTKVHDSLKVHNYTCNEVYAMSLINNETGNNDYDTYVKEQYKNILFEGCNDIFLDLTSAVGHCYIDLCHMPDIVGASLSGHKFGALQGIGLLYIRKDQQDKIKPLIYGHQEREMRGGTENTLGIISLGIAIEEATEQLIHNNQHIKQMTDYLKIELTQLGNEDDILYYSVNNHIINITFYGLRASTAVMLFDKENIAISAGSACNIDSDIPSKILIAEGMTENEALNTIRVSLGHQNTLKECERFIQTMKKIIDNYDNL